MNEEWGLTAKGFHRPVYSELLDAVEYKARELFGQSANLTVRSPLGVFLRIYSWALNLLFALLEDVYNSRFIDTAVGTSLYNLGRVIGLQLLSAQKASGYVTISGTAGTVIPAGYLVSTITNLQYSAVEDTTIGETGSVLVPVRAVITGPEYNTGAGTITVIVNPESVPGITSVTNLAAVDGGRKKETDEEFRDRYYRSVDFAGGVNSDAIAAEILQNVESVYSAVVYENDGDEVNDMGIPGHAVETIVYGGLDQDIAQAIYKRKAGGIQTYGNTRVPVIAVSGQTIDIYFSRPVAVPIYIKISNLITSNLFPNDGETQIKEAIIQYIGGSINGGLSVGTDIVFISIPGVILSVPGVIDFMLQISKDGNTYGQSNIAIAAREKAVTDVGKVVIE